MNLIQGEIFLDTSLLEPPEPFILAIEKLKRLKVGQFLHMIHRQKPKLLYPELVTLELSVETIKETEQLFHIIIWNQDDVKACEASKQLINQLKTTNP